MNDVTKVGRDPTAQILEQRSQHLAGRGTKKTKREPLYDVTVISIGDGFFALEARHLNEIVALPPITKLPGLPSHIRGVAQVRGTVMSVVDLGAYLGQTRDSEVSKELMVVASCADGPIGLTFDSLVGFRVIYADELASDFKPEHDGPLPMLAMTSDLVSVLDLEPLFEKERLRAN